MRRARSLVTVLSAGAVAVGLASSLGSCARTTDTFKPRITISNADGAASRARSFVVDGYVLDDTGVTQITVDGTPIPILPGSRKLARFQFKTLIQGSTGKYTITAQDAAGNRSTVILPVTVDAQRPAISVTRFERSGTLIRVTGTARDNTRVVQMLVDGNQINITPGREVEFYAETTGIWADLEAVDAAGNRVTLRAR
ncbi:MULTISPECIES: hypothetical protein [Deinococcus]|uniref:Uncharacterized protein n=1 Tax=Deinococcus rufus TaxID=2136097 RepID=A0ABV7ZDL8_9DEIO|nr:hypothetical protein [Deinococcus sp. AB2017081]WQE93729.1 hypothetical protein U2P90_09935 [Deinococcus sp. AB2017081]